MSNHPDIHLEEIIGENFKEEQATEPTFQQVYAESIAKQDGVVERPDLLTSYPHIKVRDHILYRIDRGKVAREEVE